VYKRGAAIIQDPTVCSKIHQSYRLGLHLGERDTGAALAQYLKVQRSCRLWGRGLLQCPPVPLRSLFPKGSLQGQAEHAVAPQAGVHLGLRHEGAGSLRSSQGSDSLPT